MYLGGLGTSLRLGLRLGPISPHFNRFSVRCPAVILSRVNISCVVTTSTDSLTAAQDSVSRDLPRYLRQSQWPFSTVMKWARLCHFHSGRQYGRKSHAIKCGDLVRLPIPMQNEVLTWHRSKWKATFGSYEDVDALKLAVKEGAEGSPCEKGLRSVCWKVGTFASAK